MIYVKYISHKTNHTEGPYLEGEVKCVKETVKRTCAVVDIGLVEEVETE
jgi:hypothetical protein